jgi:predicted Zn-dependent peptidase
MGISHLLEHLVFKGTRRRTAREIALALEARGGSLDAYTSREHTSFQAYVLERDLPVAIDVLHDLVMTPLLRDEDLELERNVILDEIAGVDDTPDDVVFEEHNARLWGDHPYGYTILGTRDTVGALGVDSIRDRHASAFRPDNMVIALGGNVDHDGVCKLLLAAGWGDTVSPSADGGGSVIPPPPTALPPSESMIERDSHQAHIVMGSTTIPIKDPSRPAFLLVSTLFGSGMSSRLFQRVREELGLAYAVYGYQSLYSDVGVHGVYVGTAPETAEKARRAVSDELKRLVDHGVGEEELALGRQQLVGQFLLSLESAGSRMQRAASCELYGEPFRSVDEVIQRIESVTTADALAVAQKWFGPERQTILTLGPADHSIA